MCGKKPEAEVMTMVIFGMKVKNWFVKKIKVWKRYWSPQECKISMDKRNTCREDNVWEEPERKVRKKWSHRRTNIVSQKKLSGVWNLVCQIPCFKSKNNWKWESFPHIIKMTFFLLYNVLNTAIFQNTFSRMHTLVCTLNFPYQIFKNYTTLLKENWVTVKVNCKT